ncbi:MAG: response regulator transcription factor [Vulcanimicrobiaceae bacterium]
MREGGEAGTEAVAISGRKSDARHRTLVGMELTRREFEIARMVAAGKSNRTIAAALNISLRSVEQRLQSIYEKTETGSRTQLALLVLSHERGRLRPLW